MQKFIVKSLFFLSPFLFLYIFIPCLYSVDQGDLLRMGYIQKDDKYRAQFKNDIHDTVYYTNISDIATCATTTCFQSKYNVLLLGDSFSEWRGFSFQNYIAKDDRISVLHYDVGINPVEILYALINGDFFNAISFDYVILQSVERAFPDRANLNPDSRIYLNEIKQTIKEKSDGFRKNIPLDNSIIKFLVINMLRFVNRDFVSSVYQFESTKPVFSSEYRDQILIYQMDIFLNPQNSDTTAIKKLNSVLNHLSEVVSEKGSTLIVLPGPDKYSIYYDYIKDREKYPEPVFCNILKSLEKQYIYIDSYEILKNAVSSGKADVYFADDTHWSPVGAKLIAETVRSKIK